MSKGTLEKDEIAADMKFCLFGDLTDENCPNRPCRKCAERKEPFTAYPMEGKGHCEWWAAEDQSGHAIFFRCFPEDDERPKTPQERFDFIMTEYVMETGDAWEKIFHRFPHDKALGKIVYLAEVNALFSRLLLRGAVRFRYATACEVAAWLRGHQEDLIALHDTENLLTALKGYVP